MQASTRLSGGRKMGEKKWRRHRRIGGECKESGSHRELLVKTYMECMCLLSQLITLYRGHGLTLYTTHTIKWKGMRCHFQL